MNLKIKLEKQKKEGKNEAGRQCRNSAGGFPGSAAD